MVRDFLPNILLLVLVTALISCSSEKSESTPPDQTAVEPSEQLDAEQPSSQPPVDAAAENPEQVSDSQVVAPQSDQPAEEAPAKNPGTENLHPDAVSFAAYDIDGNLRHSSQWVGKKPVVINFWGTWCPPCRREIPDLVKLYAEYKPRGVEIVGFAVRDTPERVRRYAKRAKMEWVMLMANQEVINSYELTGAVPTTIFLDKSGKELGRFVGARSYSLFKRGFEAVLKE